MAFITAQSVASTKANRCRLQDLPAELRNQIYEDVARETSITFSLSAVQGATVNPLAQTTSPALLLACHQTRQEFLPIMYRCANINFTVHRLDFDDLIFFYEYDFIGSKVPKADNFLEWLDYKSTIGMRRQWNYGFVWEDSSFAGLFSRWWTQAKKSFMKLQERKGKDDYRLDISAIVTAIDDEEERSHRRFLEAIGARTLGGPLRVRRRQEQKARNHSHVKG